MRLKPYRPSNLIGAFSSVHIVRIVNGIFVIKTSMLIAVHLHPIRHQRIQSHNLTLAIADDLRIRISPEKQVRHQCLPENEGSHLRIRLIMEQKIKRMFHRFLLTAIIYCNGRLATASDRILTQQYTAVICIADLSVTYLPLAVPPRKKL